MKVQEWFGKLNRNSRRSIGFILLYGFISALSGLVACAKVQFSGEAKANRPGTPGCQVNCTNINGNRNFVYSFSTGTAAADILFVIDNSASMYPIQQQIANRFNSFLSQIAAYDFHIAITNTDISTSPSNTYRSSINGVPYVQDGNFYAFPDGTKYLTNASGALSGQFGLTVARAETLNCQNWIAANCNTNVGCADIVNLYANCPSEYTRGVSATGASVLGVGASNGFIRGTDVPLNVVIVSNADEYASGGILSIDKLDTTDMPSALVAQVQTSYPGKQFKVQSVVIQPGDSACYNQQHLNSSEFGWYGNVYSSLSSMTGGYVGSICDSDYSGIMSNIASNLKTDDGSRDLPCQPLSTPTITLSPSSVSSAPSVVSSGGNWRLVFNPALPAGTTVNVDLTCVN